MDLVAKLTLALQLIALGLGVFATAFRYWNPFAGYIVLADLVGQIRQSWSEYESEATADEFAISFLSSLERLEGELRDLLFVLNTNGIKCRFRAWGYAPRIKKLLDQAQLLRVGLPLIAPVNRELRAARRRPATKDLVALQKLSRSRDEFMRVIKGDKVHIPPVPWSPSLENLHFRRQIGTPYSNDSSSETSTLPETIMPLNPKPIFSPPSPSQDLASAGKVVKKRSLKQFVSGILNKRNPCDSELPLYAKG